MKAEIEAAIAEIRREMPGNKVDVIPDEDGGVYVKVHDLDIGSTYEPSKTWVGFYLPPNYPDPDVYPHFMNLEVKRSDKADLGESFGTVEWQGDQVVQISRRTNNWNGMVDTAYNKLVKVLAWVRSR